MKRNKNIRGNGAKALKKRFSVFSVIIKYIPLALFVIMYIVEKEQIKNICRENDGIEVSKAMMIEELDRLLAEYDNVNTFPEIRDFALNELKMIASDEGALCFTVYDDQNIFNLRKKKSMPNLFDRNLNLALMEMKTVINEP